MDQLFLSEAMELFQFSYADIIENWDHYYQVYLEEVSIKPECVVSEEDRCISSILS